MWSQIPAFTRRRARWYPTSEYGEASQLAPRTDVLSLQRNILINERDTACIGDFGIATITAEDQGGSTTTKLGTDCYRAPELLNPLQFGLNNSDPHEGE